MKSPLIQFWQKTYGEFSSPLELGIEFQNPSFPDPIMSPSFVLGDLNAFLKSNPQLSHFNIITDEQLPEEVSGFRRIKQFTVGTRNLKGESPELLEFSTEILPMAEALKRDFFWTLLGEGFEKDLPFLKKLLPFLAQAPARFVTLILQHEGYPSAMISVGIQEHVALVLNAVVKKSARKLGLSKHLVASTKNLLLQEGVQDAFFWTELPFLHNHANSTQNYLIYSK